MNDISRAWLILPLLFVCRPLGAGNIPIASMIRLEGRMFHRFGTNGLLWTEAAANLLVFAVVVAEFLSRGLSLRLAETADAPTDS